MKQIISFFLSLLLVTPAPIYSAAIPTMHLSNTEFAWDMHGVLIKKNMPGLIKATLVHGAGKAAKLIGRLSYEYPRYLFTGKKGKSQELIAELKALGAGGAGGSSYAHVLNEYESGWGDMVSKIVREHVPVKGMAELIEELHELGYTHVIATNEGQQLVQEQKNQHPQLFEYIDIEHGSTVDYVPGITPIKKPDIRYFTNHQNKYNPDRAKNIIFIDDKQENVDAARKAGMIGIKFSSAHQLRKELIAQGVPLVKVNI